MSHRLPAAVWLVLAVAICTRVAALAVLGTSDPVSGSESGLSAANWLAGRGYTFDFYGYRAAAPLRSFMPPLFPAVVAAALATPWPAAMLAAVQVGLSAGVVLLVYRLGAELAGQGVGLAAAALTAVYPPFLVLVTQPTVPVLNMFLLAAWLWSVTRLAATRSLRWAAVAGGVLGLCVLSRPSTVGLLAVAGLAVWLRPEGRGGSWLRTMAVAAAALLLVVAPWLARGAWINGRPVWISTNGGFNFWIGNNPFTTGSCFDVVPDDLARYSGERPAAPAGDSIVEVKPYPLPLELRRAAGSMDEVALDSALYRAGLAYAALNPAEWGRLMLHKLAGLWWFRPNVGRSSGLYRESWILPYQVLYGGVVALALAGLAVSLRRWRRYLPLYGLFAYLTAVYVTYHVITRYRWEFEPLVLLLSALALSTGARAVRGRLRARRPMAAPEGA